MALTVFELLIPRVPTTQPIFVCLILQINATVFFLLMTQLMLYILESVNNRAFSTFISPTSLRH